MSPARSVLDGDVVLTEQVQPPTLLAYGLGRLHEVGERCMICSDDDWSSEQMLAKLLEAVHHAEKLTAGNTVSALRRCQSTARVADNMQLPTLLLLQNSTKSDV